MLYASAESGYYGKGFAHLNNNNKNNNNMAMVIEEVSHRQ